MARPPDDAQKLASYIQTTAANGQKKLPADPQQPGRVSIRRVATAADVPYTALAGRHARLRKQLDAAVAKLGLAVIPAPPPPAHVTTLGAAKGALLASVRAALRAQGLCERPVVPALKTSIEILARRSRLGLATPLAEVAEKFARDVEAGVVRKAEASQLADVLDQLKAASVGLGNDDLPADFAGALRTACARAGVNLAAAAREIGIRPANLSKCTNGERGLTRRWRQRCEALARWLGLPADTFVKRLAHARRAQGRIEAKAFPDHLQGHTPALRRRRRAILEQIGSQAYLMTSDAFRVRAAEVDAAIGRHDGRDPHQDLREDRYALRDPKKLAAEVARRDKTGVKETLARLKADDDPRLAPQGLLAELDAYIAFRSGPTPPPGLVRLKKSRLSPRTIETYRSRTFRLGGFLVGHAAPALRVPRERLTLALFASPHHLEAFLQFRGRRNKTALDDETLTDADIEFLRFAATLVDPVDGFLTQQESFRDLFIAAVGDAPLFCDPRDMSWPQFCDRVHDRLLKLIKSYGRSKRRPKRPVEKIPPINDMAMPLTIVGRMLTRQRAETTLLKRGTTDWARAMRDLVIIGIAGIVAFRRETMVRLDWVETAGDRAGDLRRLDGPGGHSYRWKVPPEKFKNRDAEEVRDGPFDEALPDYEGFYADLDLYLAEARPILLGGADSDALIVNYAGHPRYGVDVLGNRIRYLTARLVGASAPAEWRFPGLKHVNAHLFRDILATSIVRATRDIRAAARALHITDKVALERYVHMTKSDGRAEAERNVSRTFAAAGRKPERMEHDDVPGA